MAVKVYILLKEGGYSCVLYSYCPGEQIVHNYCELESETLVSVTCVELLAI
jgi:hypothetical protein